MPDETVPPAPAAEAENTKKKPPLTVEQFTALVDAYRLEPYGHKFAASKAGCGKSTAETAFYKGSPRLGLGPIRDMLDSEQEEVRAKLAAATAQQEKRKIEVVSRSESARQQALDARASEGMMLSMGRMNVRGALVGLGELMPAVNLIAADVTARLQRAIEKGDMSDISVREAARLLRDISASVNSVAGATQKLIEAERTFVGEPAKMIGLQIGSPQIVRERAKAALAIIGRRNKTVSAESEIMDVVPVSLDE